VSRASAEGHTDRSGPWPLVPWLIPAIAVLLSRLQVVDLAYQVRAGQIMLDSSAVLRADPFTYTIPGAPWLDQQWGAQLTFSAWFQVGGWRALIVLQAVIVASCFGATYRATITSGATAMVAACATALGFVVAAALPGALALRPQLLALPLFVASAWIIRRRDAAPGHLLFLVPLGVLWVNIHGSFLLLSLMLAIAVVADLLRGRVRSARWAGSLFALSLIAPLATPWGWSVYRYLWDLARSPIVRRVITEWQPIWSRPVAAFLFVTVCATAGTVIARRARRAPTFEEAATFLVFTGLAVWSQRNVLWWSVTVPPLAGGLLAGWRPGGEWSRVATRLAAACLAALLVVGAWRIATTPESELLTEAPAGITAWLVAHPESGGHVFAEWWGWWFEYAVPAEPMFVDARVEVFPQDIWSQYGAIVDVQDGWMQVIDRWQIDTIILARDHHPDLEAALRSDPSWSLVYEDADGFVFTRQ
jgi:hypothetical protein